VGESGTKEWLKLGKRTVATLSQRAEAESPHSNQAFLQTLGRIGSRKELPCRKSSRASRTRRALCLPKERPDEEIGNLLDTKREGAYSKSEYCNAV